MRQLGLSDGLPYDRCDLGIVTDLDGAALLADHDIQDVSQMPKVLRTQVDVVLDHGFAVLNAGEADVAAMAPLCDGEVIFYAADPAAPALTAHLNSGGRSVRLQGRTAELLQGTTVQAEVDLPRWACAAGRVEAVLAAIAGAWALGISCALLRAGIENFPLDASRQSAPNKIHSSSAH